MSISKRKIELNKMSVMWEEEGRSRLMIHKWVVWKVMALTARCFSVVYFLKIISVVIGYVPCEDGYEQSNKYTVFWNYLNHMVESVLSN